MSSGGTKFDLTFLPLLLKAVPFGAMVSSASRKVELGFWMLLAVGLATPFGRGESWRVVEKGSVVAVSGTAETVTTASLEADAKGGRIGGPVAETVDVVERMDLDDGEAWGVAMASCEAAAVLSPEEDATPYADERRLVLILESVLLKGNMLLQDPRGVGLSVQVK